MYKLELNKKGKIINCVDDWYSVAPPKNPSLHWKDGRSAKELAKYMTSIKGYMPKEIEDILVKLGCNTNIIFYGEPEAVTSLEGRGGGRHHDLLLVQENEVMIGVEAKSDEYFGKIVCKELFGNKDYMMSCACSAGPAFEGGGISCGMRASNGAIEKVKIDEKTLNPTLTTIGDADPIGICGSGIIDLICQMILTGIIDRRGKIHRDIDNRRIRFNEYEMGEYVLAFKEEYNLEQDITVNEVDIDNFIKAKGAIYSGASVLIESLGMDFSVIDKVYIAGGIGNNLNIENSILIGLLPDIEREKFVYIGNSSLVGSYLALISKDAKKKVQEIGTEMTYVELSVYPTYMDEFISACFLPHTNIEQFPTVKAILGE